MIMLLGGNGFFMEAKFQLSSKPRPFYAYRHHVFCTMGERFIFSNPDGDVVKLDPTEDSQCVLAINGIPTEYAIRNRINVELPSYLLPKPRGDDTMPSMTPDSNEERANIVEPTATSLDPRPGLKRKAAMANLDDLELN